MVLEKMLIYELDWIIIEIKFPKVGNNHSYGRNVLHDRKKRRKKLLAFTT